MCERGPSGLSDWLLVIFAGCVTCGNEPQPATLVDFRGSILSDAGSIPAISTFQKRTEKSARFWLYILNLMLY